MKNLRFLWLLAALVLLALGAWLTLSEDEDEDNKLKRDVVFPRMMQKDRQRAEKRRRALILKSLIAGQAETQSYEKDPFLVALSAIPTSGTTMIIEAGAIKSSPVGEMLLACLDKEENSPFDELREEFGINPVEAVDRIAITKGHALLSGDFADAQWAKLFDRFDERAYGDKGMLYQPTPGTEDNPEKVGFGVWDDELVVMSQEDDSMNEDIVDMLEGRANYDGDEFPEEEAYGEIYGTLSVDDAVELIPKEKSDLAERFRQAVSDVNLHVNTQSDVTIVAEVKGEDSEQLEELAKTLGGALSLLRIKARTDGEKELVELLDHASVKTDGAGFRLELALPLEMIREQLGECAEQ